MARWQQSQFCFSMARYRRWLTVCLLCLLIPPIEIAVADVTLKQLEGKLRVEVDGQLFTEYLTRGYAKPIFFPLLGPTAAPMTRSFPMIKDVVGEAADHPHHKSLWYTHGNVNDIDFWSEGEGRGQIVHKRTLHVADGPDRGTLATENDWVDSAGKLVCKDRREFWFHAQPTSRSIDLRVTLFATQGDLVLKDTKEGTFGVRTHPNLRLDRKGEQFANMTGNAVNSAGDRDHSLWGKRAAWVDYSGKIDGQTVGLAMFDHPSNPRHPTWWHARNYGLVAANPFGIHDFENRPDQPSRGDFKIAAGQSVTFSYRVLLHLGDASQADVAGHYEAFKSEIKKALAPTDSSARPASRVGEP